jgi:hypothetical protein
VHGEQVDEALRCVLADAQVEEVVGGQAAIAATAAETTADGWHALVAGLAQWSRQVPLLVGGQSR